MIGVAPNTATSVQNLRFFGVSIADKIANSMKAVKMFQAIDADRKQSRSESLAAATNAEHSIAAHATIANSRTESNSIKFNCYDAPIEHKT